MIDRRFKYDRVDVMREFWFKGFIVIAAGTLALFSFGDLRQIKIGSELITLSSELHRIPITLIRAGMFA